MNFLKGDESNSRITDTDNSSSNQKHSKSNPKQCQAWYFNDEEEDIFNKHKKKFYNIATQGFNVSKLVAHNTNHTCRAKVC